MIKRTWTLFLIPFLIGSIVFLLCHGDSHAMDTDLYTVTGQQVPPNVLIILDNSSSMTNTNQGPDYNPSVNDTPPGDPPTYDGGSYSTNAVYRKVGNSWVFFKDSYSEISCPSAQSILRYEGTWSGKINISDTTCAGGKYDKQEFLSTGNYLNFLALPGSGTGQPRLGLAKGVIHSYVNSTQGINFGLMVFNGNNHGQDGHGGYVAASITNDKNVLFSALSGINTSDVVNWTPLAETLYEAMLYFKGGTSYYNPGTAYNSPIQYRCQKNYILLITDGMPSYDVADESTSPVKTVIGDYDQDGKDPGNYPLYGSHYLDDVASYVHQNDMSPLTGRQNITVYTVGFNPDPNELDSQLLQFTASKGGGKYFYAHNAQSFRIAFQLIIEEVLRKSTSFVAPTVPISQMEKTASGDRMYLGMFKPSEKSFWKGNIKKFGIATANDPVKGIVVGDVLDKNGNLAIDPETNEIYDTAVSYLSTTEDGGDVERGGVGEILLKRDLSTRKIFTYLGTNVNLTDPSNAFTTANITPALLGLTTTDDKNKLINFLYGYDAYDDNLNLNMTEKRSWILGGILHSRPLVIHYSSGTVIFAGANDGMLHAFDDATGEEMWAFIPSDLLAKLKNLTGNTVEFFVDGAPKAYVTESKVILVSGERRGGNRYFALDITDPLNPKWLWEIHPGLTDYAQMGQTWSTPLMGKIKYGSGDKWVIFIGGGYDTNQDNLPVPSNQMDTTGKAVYVVDVLDGSLIKKWEYSATDNPRMKYSIPSDIARVDTDGDGRIDRLYVGDMGGQIWRFDIGNPSPTSWTAKCIFDASDPPPTSGDRRKIFYPPDVSLEKDNGGYYELLVFGTGDREHPKSTLLYDGIYYDRLYTVKDRNPSSVLTQNDLVNVTDDLLQTGTADEKQQIFNALKSGSGWYVNLNQNSGEKCLSPSLVFFGVSYYSTFAPSSDAVTDPCFVGEGAARLYAMSYLTGNAVFNFDLTNDVGGTSTLARSDRVTAIGRAIPSGAIIAIIGGSTTTGYIGIGGGVFKAPLKKSKVLIPIYWRQRF